MTKITNRFALFALLLISLQFQSCDKNNPNFVDNRDDFVGEWDVWEISYNETTQENDTFFYSMEIYKAGTDSDVILDAGPGNIYKAGCGLTGIVGGARLSIPLNACDFGNGLFYEFEGDGYITDDKQQIILDMNVQPCDGYIGGSHYCSPNLARTFRIDALKL